MKKKEPKEGSGSKKVIEVSRYMMQIYRQPNNILDWISWGELKYEPLIINQNLECRCKLPIWIKRNNKLICWPAVNWNNVICLISRNVAWDNVCASAVLHFNKLKLPRHYELCSGYLRLDWSCDLVDRIRALLESVFLPECLNRMLNVKFYVGWNIFTCSRKQF